MRLQWPVSFREEKAETISISTFLERLAAQNRVFSGVSVTPENALKCTTVQGIVRALTNAIGSYPVYIAKQTEPAGEVFEPQPDHRANRLLRKPNGIHTQTEFWRMVMRHASTYGNFYAIKGGGVTGPTNFLRPIEDPDRVSVEDINWRDGVTWKVQFEEGERIVRQSQMFHVTSGIPAADGVTGISPIEKAKQAIGICLAAEQLIAQLYGNNDVPTLAVMGGQFRNEETYKTWADRFKEALGGAGRGGTIHLPEGMQLKELSFKPVDAQLLEMRKFQRIEIAQVYGVPPHKLADLERATFSNIEEQSLEFVRDVAKPWVCGISQSATRDLLTEQDREAGLVVRFDMTAATEGRLNDRLDAFGKAYDRGAMNPNEIRARIGMSPRTDEGGDAYVTQMNMRPTNDGNASEAESQSSAQDDETDDAKGRPVRAV